MLYASYRVLMGLLPKFEAQWREMLSGVGLDQDDPGRDPASPAGIGIRAVEAVLASRLHDGMNRLGDEGGRQYYRQPYADYLGYRPVNAPDSLLNPGRWQPDGVHFSAARAEDAELGTRIGDRVYSFVDRHIRGAVGPLR